MNSKELLELLDLQNPHPTNDDPGQDAPHPTRKESDSPTALDIDSWGLRRGNDLFAASERIGALDVDSFGVADCHSAAFDAEPRLLPRCVDPVRREFFAALLETPEYRSLHESTKLDVSASEIAAAHFAEELDRFCKESDPKGTATDVEREVRALRAVGRAVKAAHAEVEECGGAMEAFGMGPGSTGRNDPRAIAALFCRVRNDPRLRAICSLAGRYRRLAQSRQRRKTRHGLDDIVGIEMSGDLGRVLPHELLMLATPPFDQEAMRRFSERQLMSREHRATEAVAKGPIIVVVDESGSMEGEPIHAAKAIALALAWIARQQNRWCALVAYSGDSGERLLPLPPSGWDEHALAEWLIAFLGRGSSLDVPIRELPRMMSDLVAPRRETDVIIVTDCICQIPTLAQEDFNSWRKEVQARVITLVIGGDAADLSHVSDEVHLVRTLAVDEEAVGRALSI